MTKKGDDHTAAQQAKTLPQAPQQQQQQKEPPPPTSVPAAAATASATAAKRGSREGSSSDGGGGSGGGGGSRQGSKSRSSSKDADRDELMSLLATQGHHSVEKIGFKALDFSYSLVLLCFPLTGSSKATFLGTYVKCNLGFVSQIPL